MVRGEDLRGSGHTWLNCAAMAGFPYLLEPVVVVPPFSFLGAMQGAGGALASLNWPQGWTKRPRCHSNRSHPVHQKDWLPSVNVF